MSSVDDFDPLSSSDIKMESERPLFHRGLSLTNPTYPYFTPQHLPQSRDLDLLKEYGLDRFNSVQSTPAHSSAQPQSLDFSSLSISAPPSTQKPQLNWTKFD